jgi:hypothetical protein
MAKLLAVSTLVGWLGSHISDALAGLAVYLNSMVLDEFCFMFGTDCYYHCGSFFVWSCFWPGEIVAGQ